jgi:hypothetical protein
MDAYVVLPDDCPIDERERARIANAVTEGSEDSLDGTIDTYITWLEEQLLEAL